MTKKEFDEIYEEIILKLPTVNSEEDLIYELKNFLTLYRRDRTYKIGENIDFSRLLISYLLLDGYSDSLKSIVLNIIAEIHSSSSFYLFENLMREDYLYKALKQAFEGNSVLLLPFLKVCRFKYNDKRFIDLVIAILVKNVANKEVRRACTSIFTYGSISGAESRDINETVFAFVQKQYKSGTKCVLTKKEIIKITFYYWVHEDSFSFMAEMFCQEDRESQEEIVNHLKWFMHNDLQRPSLQRALREINKTVCAWNDEEITGSWLAYIVLVHRETTFGGTDEVLEFTNSVDNDVFHYFIKALVDEYVMYGYEIYECDFYDKIKNLIIKRKHPCEKRLLMALEDLRSEI